MLNSNEIFTYTCSSNAVDIILAIVWEVIVLKMKRLRLATDLLRERGGGAYNDVSNILDI